MGDSFDAAPENADAQMMTTFGHLGPLFSMKPHLAEPQKNKRHKGRNDAEWPETQGSKGPSTQMLHNVCCHLTQLVLRQEMELSHLRCQDTFVLHLTGDTNGALPILMKAAGEWKQHQQEGKVTKPLRAYLVQLFFQELQSRLSNVQAVSLLESPKNALWTTLLKKNLVSSEGDWPYLKWDHSTGQMIPNPEKAALTMKRLSSILDGIIEGIQDHSCIQRFASLGQSEVKTLPWKLQISLKCDDLIQGLTLLCHSAVLTLVGATMKVHQAQHSKMALQLQTLMGKGSGKSKKGKGKSPTSPAL